MTAKTVTVWMTVPNGFLPGGGPSYHPLPCCTIKQGISSEDSKKITKLIRDEGPKGVKAQIQGDELRVSSKKRDDLQAVQALVKQQDYDFAVQFTNYR